MAKLRSQTKGSDPTIKSSNATKVEKAAKAKKKNPTAASKKNKKAATGKKQAALGTDDRVDEPQSVEQEGDDGAHANALPLEQITTALKSLQETLNNIERAASTGCPCLLKSQQSTYEPKRVPTSKTTGSPCKGAAPALPQANLPDAPELGYPTGVLRTIDADPCAVWSRLYRYWSISRSLDPQTFSRIDSPLWVGLPEAFNAINAVTEAITRSSAQAANRENFGLWTNQALDLWRFARSGADPEAPMPLLARTSEETGRLNRWPLPFWIPLIDKKALDKKIQNSKKTTPTAKADIKQRYIDKQMFQTDATDGHTVLLEYYEVAATGRKKLDVYDSHEYFQKHEGAYDQITKQLGIDVGWGEYDERRMRECAWQSGNTCTLHAIVNAWIRALDLTTNAGFEANESFYVEAVQMVNLPLAGYLNSATLVSWLKCRQLVESDKAYTEVNQFTCTWPARGETSFETTRSSMLTGEAEFVEEMDRRPSIETDPGSPGPDQDVHSTMTVTRAADV